jgi:hypothetical protein
MKEDAAQEASFWLPANAVLGEDANTGLRVGPVGLGS